jgi:hypothetical protein
MKTSVAGRWRIVEMDVWDSDAIDLLGPAFLEFDRKGQGSFRFVAVEGWMDVRPAEHGEAHAVEFSWEGHDELDDASGRGWAVVGDDGDLTGRIFFHLGDDSTFRAVRG